MRLSHLHQGETVALKLCIYWYRNVYELAILSGKLWYASYCADVYWEWKLAAKRKVFGMFDHEQRRRRMDDGWMGEGWWNKRKVESGALTIITIRFDVGWVTGRASGL